MAYVYLNNEDWIRIYERAKKEGKKQSDILKEELNKKPIEKQVIKTKTIYERKIKGKKCFQEGIKTGNIIEFIGEPEFIE